MQGHVALGLQNGGRSHALGAAVLDVHAAYHLVFGAACPVFGVALGAEGFSLVGQSVLRTTGRGGDCCHQIRTPKADWRTSTVPILYLLAMEPFMRPLP